MSVDDFERLLEASGEALLLLFGRILKEVFYGQEMITFVSIFESDIDPGHEVELRRNLRPHVHLAGRDELSISV